MKINTYNEDVLPNNNPINCVLDKTDRNLIVLQDLLPLLGFRDVRSVKTWCEKNKIPLFTVGKKTYTIANFLSLFIDKQLSVFLNAHYDNPDGIRAAIEADDKIRFSQLTEAPVDKRSKKEYKKNVKMSKASQNLIDKLKSA